MQNLSVILVTTFFVLTSGCGSSSEDDDHWWLNAVVYQIYPRSFKDSDGDGIGDLVGITSKLEHIKEIGAQAFWLSPVYPSPQKDFGYDISNFTDIHNEYGTLDDFENLVSKAESLGLKVLMDFVPNHSSAEHEWFQKSILKVKPYDDYYIWKDGKVVNGSREPPNNWLSAFGGSAWQWNPVRKQFYLHQFDATQPDLNYRNPRVVKEMENVLKFWIERGVSGFRIDAINHLFEDSRLRDEPLSGNNVPSNDYSYLRHIYTQDLPETYRMVYRWRLFLDRLARSRKSESYFILTETYTTVPLNMRYYLAGSNAPMNFAFITDLNKDSSASDIKKSIDKWLTQIPKGYVPNWVTGNHDNHRVATRFGLRREDQMTALAMVLPGIGIVYNGDEIGMTDVWLTYNQTRDPVGCYAGPDQYEFKSRDPERSPYQWDNTTSAGFSTNETTWLPVNPNYSTLNVAIQKAANVSHFKVFQDLTALRKSPVLQKGAVEISILATDVLAVVRRLKGYTSVVLLVNTSNQSIKMYDTNLYLNIPKKMMVYTASVSSNILKASVLDMTELTLPGAATVIFGDQAKNL